jgi:hypothetical protein
MSDSQDLRRKPANAIKPAPSSSRVPGSGALRISKDSDPVHRPLHIWPSGSSPILLWNVVDGPSL